MIDSLLFGSGAILWLVVLLVLLSLLSKALWDGFRALTVVIWGSKICKRKTGSYFFKGMLGAFFSNWATLLGTRSGSITLHGDGGYWNDWNDWKVYGERK